MEGHLDSLSDLVDPSGSSLNELLLTVDRASFVDIK